MSLQFIPPLSTGRQFCCVFRFEPFRRAFAEDPTPPSWRNESYATYSSSKHSRLLGMEFAWGALWFNVCRSHRIHGAAILMVTWIPSIYPSHVSIYTSTMDPSWDVTIVSRSIPSKHRFRIEDTKTLRISASRRNLPESTRISVSY